MAKYEGKKIIEKILELIDESPESEYSPTECFYTKGMAGNGKCGCLVGQAIVRAYPELKKPLAALDAVGVYPIGIAISRLDIECGTKEEIFLTKVQGRQDSGEEWQHCVTPEILELIRE